MFVFKITWLPWIMLIAAVMFLFEGQIFGAIFLGALGAVSLKLKKMLLG